MRTMIRVTHLIITTLCGKVKVKSKYKVAYFCLLRSFVSRSLASGLSRKKEEEMNKIRK
jgi:hypothetical protein